MGAEAASRGGTRTSKVVAAVVGPKRKTTGQGLCVSWAQRGVKAARGEAFPHEGGGKRAGRHRLTAIWAERAGWADREVEAQWGEGE
jgi:hypothetical protein